MAYEAWYLQNTVPIPAPLPPTTPPTVQQVVDRIVQKVGSPASPGARASRSDAGIDGSYNILLDIGGEGRLTVDGMVSGNLAAINVNDKDRVSVAGPQGSTPIGQLVMVQSWASDPEYPFVDGFADMIMMMGAPLTSKNVQEIARVIREGGEINLWISDSFTQAMNDLAALVGSFVETPPEASDAFNVPFQFHRIRAGKKL